MLEVAAESVEVKEGALGVGIWGVPAVLAAIASPQPPGRAV